MSRPDGTSRQTRWLMMVAAIVAAAPLAAQVDWMRARLEAHEIQAMAYDQERDRMVLFGTAYETGWSPATDHTTWEWDAHAWFERTSANVPSPRETLGLAYDVARRQTVLFGGLRDTTRLGDTWLWDGADWSLANPANSPPPRLCYTLAYDSARQVVVLFGGWGSGSVLGDTWEWDGVTWTQRFPLNNPHVRRSHSMTYDAARQRVVMFGGYFQGGPQNDTWTWDGTDWTPQAPANSPPPLAGHGLAYDSARQVVVLFGGLIDNQFATSDQTWEWDGRDWSRARPAASPAGRFFHGMAYRPGTGTVVTGGYGGANASLDRMVPGPADTWSWDGTTWTLLEAAKAPPVRSEHAAAFDPVRRRSVVFGGAYLSSGTRRDVWEWDGAAWRDSTPAFGGPSARRGATMAWDGVNQQVLLFGGHAPTPGQLLGDTWLWSGTGWTSRNPTNGPTARRQQAMAWDPIRNQIVLFGGVDASGILDDTWTWNGLTWTQHHPPVSPTFRYGHAMAFDSVSQAVLLFGGLPMNSETWQWNGSVWTQVNLPPAQAPSARSMHAMAHDPGRNVVVLTAGRDSTGLRNDAWEWNGNAWQPQTPPSGPPGARAAHSMTPDPLDRMVIVGGDSTTSTWHDTWLYGVMRRAMVTTSGTACSGLLGDPRIVGSVPQLGGDRFVLDLLNLQPNAMCVLEVGAVKAATPIGHGQCTLYVDVNQPSAGLLTSANAAGFVSAALRIQPDPSLMGLPLTAQGVALDWSAPIGLTFTRALDLVIGH
ncbi:MAG: hypothetical protein IPM29_11660 [Planctomycetes bacterium]|nr:hypothetical protein [Planctomycetota bacterium]